MAALGARARHGERTSCAGTDCTSNCVTPQTALSYRSACGELCTPLGGQKLPPRDGPCRTSSCSPVCTAGFSVTSYAGIPFGVKRSSALAGPALLRSANKSKQILAVGVVCIGSVSTAINWNKKRCNNSTKRCRAASFFCFRCRRWRNLISLNARIAAVLQFSQFLCWSVRAG